jgi:aminopeptidase-like protein
VKPSESPNLSGKSKAGSEIRTAQGLDLQYSPEAKLIETYFDRLWPILRSIAGEGVRQTHDILGELAQLQRYEFPSGDQVLDWIVPPEWRVREAYVVRPDGVRILDVRKNNLHLLNYSVPFKGTVTREELDAHLFSYPEHPNAIPYQTCYYKPNWGFCIAHADRVSLPPGEYQVVIDTELFQGSLTVSEAVLPGKTDQQVLFSTYTCHPSLAINELSGPLLTAFLYRRIAAWPQRRLTYRFVFAPETIGAICFLSRFGRELTEKLLAGYVVTCVGDDANFTLKRSKRGDTIADRAADYVLERRTSSHRVLDFFPSGSDERQYCSLGFNLPVASIMRTVYGEYPEYHSSDDNKSLMDFQAMVRTLDLYEETARTIDRNLTVRNKIIYGEPQFGRRGDLYAALSPRKASNPARALKWLTHFADGKTDLLQIAQRSGLDLELLAEVAERGVEMSVFEKIS